MLKRSVSVWSIMLFLLYSTAKLIMMCWQSALGWILVSDIWCGWYKCLHWSIHSCYTIRNECLGAFADFEDQTALYSWGYDPTIAAARTQQDMLHCKALKLVILMPGLLIESVVIKWLLWFGLLRKDTFKILYLMLKIISIYHLVQRLNFNFSCDDINCHFLSIATKGQTIWTIIEDLC